MRVVMEVVQVKKVKKRSRKRMGLVLSILIRRRFLIVIVGHLNRTTIAENKSTAKTPANPPKKKTINTKY